MTVIGVDGGEIYVECDGPGCETPCAPEDGDGKSVVVSMDDDAFKEDWTTVRWPNDGDPKELHFHNDDCHRTWAVKTL